MFGKLSVIEIIIAAVLLFFLAPAFDDEFEWDMPISKPLSGKYEMRGKMTVCDSYDEAQKYINSVQRVYAYEGTRDLDDDVYGDCSKSWSTRYNALELLRVVPHRIGTGVFGLYKIRHSRGESFVVKFYSGHLI